MSRRIQIEAELLLVQHAKRHARNNADAFGFRAGLARTEDERHEEMAIRGYWQIEAEKALVREQLLRAELAALAAY